MDLSLVIDDSGRLQATLEPADVLYNAVLLSLHIRRGSFFVNPVFGSRLHEIRTLSDSDVALARQYAAECIEWLRAINRVSSINVSAVAVRGGKLNLNITLGRGGSPDIVYETFLKVV